MNVFHYRLFGLNVASELEFPELVRAMHPQSTDVVLRLGNLCRGDVDKQIWEYSADQQVMQHPKLGSIAIVGSGEILVDPKPGVSTDLLAFPLLGPIFALLLHIRGHFALHASAVKLGSAGLGFLGDKGAGKSTAAATLLQHADASLIADDLVAFDGAGHLLPSFAQVKLSTEALGRFSSLDGTLRVAPMANFPKNQVRLKKEPPETPTPTRALFELRRATEARIESMSFEDAMRVLLRFSYVSRFVERVLSPEERRRIFEQATALARSGVVKRLYVPDTLQNLPRMVDLLRSEAC
jgi:hypothetical protein